MEDNAITTLDAEILAEERLGEDQELMLYNMSLRQTSQRAAGGREGTHVLVSRIENNPAYQQMIDRGLLECRLYGNAAGASAAATLVVTRKGLRYCVLYASEIEPRRTYDSAGVRREHAGGAGKPSAGDGVDYAALTSGAASGTSAAKEAASGLTAEQVARYERLGAQRRGAEGDAAHRPLASPTSPGGGDLASDDGMMRLTVTPDMTFTGFSVDTATVGLSPSQVEQISEIGERRKSLGRRERAFAFDHAREVLEWEGPSGNVWSYVEAGGEFAQIVGVSGEASQLRIPEQVAGLRVVSIAANAFSMNDAVREVVCPDGVDSIGSGAFRQCSNLERLVLPAHVQDFDASWIARCPNLQELVLPGLLERVDRAVFESPNLKRLVIGPCVHDIEPGAFQGSQLEEVVVDDANPFIAVQDGALYTKDRSVLFALVRPMRTLAVANGCRQLAKKSCYGCEELEEVQLPDTLVEVGPFAFAYTGLVRFDAPARLETIDEKAFFSCRSLHEAALNDGLVSIGESAFEGTALGALALPATIARLGKSMTRNTGIVHSGPGCTLTIDGDCADLFLDGQGGLYRRCEDGPHLVQLVDGDIERYRVYDGAVAIDPHAFAFHDAISWVHVPDSVRTIGRSAFRICKNLRQVELPDSIEAIGEEAFLDTNLEELRVPAGLRELGDRALVTYGAHHGNGMPSLARITVAPGNEVFHETQGMLCRKTAAGASVVVFASGEPRVVLPEDITHIEEYAFSNARGIEYLALNARLSSIGTNGLATRCWIRHIHVDLAKPLEGRLAFDFYFPETPGAVRGIALGLGGASWVNVPGIMEQLDLCLVSARDYNVPNKAGNISAYAQAKLILDRLDDPVMLTPRNKVMMERVLRNNIEDVCVDVALYDDRSVLDDLIARGYVNAENLDGVIERVNTLKDAASTAYLLEAKREKFGHDAFDYDL